MKLSKSEPSKTITSVDSPGGKYGLSASGGNLVSDLDFQQEAKGKFLCVSFCSGACSSNCSTSCSTKCSTNCGANCAAACSTSCSTSCSSKCWSLCSGGGAADVALIESEEDIVL